MSPLKVGAADVVDVRVGSVEAQAVYVGSALVWQRAAPFVEVLNVAQSDLSISNRTQHIFQYDFVSDVQDGSVACIVLFLGDDGDEVRSNQTLGQTLIVESAHNDAGGIWAAYYVPSQTDLDNGFRVFQMNTAATEVYQCVVIEVRGANTAALIEDYYYDGSNADRQTVTGGSLDLSAGALAIAVSCGDDTRRQAATLDPDEGFTVVASYPGITGLPNFTVALKQNVGGLVSMPTFVQDAADEQSIVALGVAPA